MSRIPRTPPSKNSLSGSRSESDLSTTASASNSGESNVTTRNKRPRMNSSPKGPSSSPGFPSGDLRTDLLNMLSDWKRDQDRRLDEWKISLDDTLSKLLWDTIRKLTHTSKLCRPAEQLISPDNPSESVNFINKFFVSIGKDLAEKAYSSGRGCISSMANPLSSLVLDSTDENEVRNCILNLKKDKCTGRHNISGAILKRYHQIIVPPLTFIPNRASRIIALVPNEHAPSDASEISDSETELHDARTKSSTPLSSPAPSIASSLANITIDTSDDEEFPEI
ncbi:unnamed protein product [Pieris brassicae]|uniref:Uncharacterized protein n=1 Tax=Pieris brassicae TaxID=7116 RepID=A0A9P0TSE6_PIEBR|nr:unnamed protein product [Pieris brassicae]